MTDAERIQALVLYRLEQAEEALAAAQSNLVGGFERSAISRAYYSMFYAVLALLATTRTETSRHGMAIAQFDQHYVKTALFTKEYSRSLHEAFLHRQKADYGTVKPTLTREQIQELLTDARHFVDGVRKYLQSQSFA